VPLDLSDLDRTVLQRSPLSSVICQIRYDKTDAASSPRVAQQFYEALSDGGSRFSRLDQILESTFGLAMGPGAAPALAQQPGSSGWRLISPDGARTISLLPTHVAVEATAYEGWDNDFAPLLYETLAAVAKHVQPVFEQRVGLRYVNQITSPEVAEPQQWHGLVDAAFLPIATHTELGPLTTFLRQSAILELEEGVRCTINSGFAPDPDRDELLTFLLDFDIAREGTREFITSEIEAAVSQFNSYALRLFQLAVTSDLREALAHA
jgi:uncharacterized protein (TIGR04255 family)